MNNEFQQALDGIEAGADLCVRYRSARSDEDQTRCGKIQKVDKAPSGAFYIEFRREDGQVMAAHSDKKVKSEGSHFPVTGFWYSLNVHPAPAGSKRSPEAADG